ncbi:uncharacterized protein LOC134227484 [Armigeres subalbatus]|uniref:uncharacterized protein LOC134227484 n=1 Tax=Armigeres subalbatus TaxID=124917 RepID=UPI002ED54262
MSSQILKVVSVINKNNQRIQLLQRKKRLLKALMTNLIRKQRNLCLLQENKTVERRVWTSVENSSYWENDVPNFCEKKFKNTFRVSRSTFDFLVDKLQNIAKMDTLLRPAIPLAKRIAIALYALGSSAEYRTIGSLFGVGRTTVGELVLVVSQEIVVKLGSCFLNAYPPSHEKIEEIVSGFEQMGFPQCYGAVDGSHIEQSLHQNQRIVDA